MVLFLCCSLSEDTQCNPKAGGGTKVFKSPPVAPVLVDDVVWLLLSAPTPLAFVLEQCFDHSTWVSRWGCCNLQTRFQHSSFLNLVSHGLTVLTPYAVAHTSPT